MSAVASVDLLVVAVAGAILMIVEGTRLGWAKWVWGLVALERRARRHPLVE